MINSLFDPVEQVKTRVRPFVYRDWAAPAETLPTDNGAPAPVPIVDDDRLTAREAQARQEGRREAESTLSEQFERRLQSERVAMEAALETFAAERRKYFQQLERDVVNLSLALARKVLRREAQLDPLLLAGSVRVALDQLAAHTQVELRVAPSQLPIWQAWLSQLDTACIPTLHPDPELEPVGCRLLAETGSTDLSFELQLSEIERGVMELVERRAHVRGDSGAPSTPTVDFSSEARKSVGASAFAPNGSAAKQRAARPA